MQPLSSSITPITKFVLPGGFLAVLPFWILQTQDTRFGYFPAMFWVAACAFLVWWTAPIKKVALRGDEFIVSNYWKEVVIPSASLVKIREDRWNRTPNITLFFDPPTAFGRKIRIIPPYELWRRREFDRIALLLREIAEKKKEPNKRPETNAGKESVSPTTSGPGVAHP